MHGTGIWNHLRNALLSALALLAAACGKGSDPAASTGDADAAPAGSAAASAAAPPAAAEGASKPAAPPRIQVTLKDLQLFHPYSTERAMPSVKDDGSVGTRDARPRYGIGLIVEATNETGELLGDAWFEGAIRLTGSGGRELVCELRADIVSNTTNARFLSFAPKPAGAKAEPGEVKTDWKDETESSIEAPWRPSERIRLATRENECEAAFAGDLAATSVKGRIVLKARKIFTDVAGYNFDDKGYDLTLESGIVRIRDKRSSRVVLMPTKEVTEMIAAPGAAPAASPLPLSRVRLSHLIRSSDIDLIESDPVEFDIHPRALTLQLVKIPGGEMEHASGNVVIRLKEGKVVYEEMARLKMSLLGIERADVPKTSPEVSFEADELSGKVVTMALTSSVEDGGLVKGQRKLTTTWKLGLKGDQIDSRLRSDFDTTSAAADAAERAAFQLDMNKDADKAAVAKAKADAASAKAAKDAAERKYKSGLSNERGRLLKLFSCSDVRLATNKAVRSPANGKAAADACKGLESGTEAEVVLSYLLERYEVPVALVYSLGKDPSWKPVASEALIKLDPR